MIGQSQSGTGKTAAFVLTMLSRVDFNLDKPQVSIYLFIFEVFFPYETYPQINGQILGSMLSTITRTCSSNYVCYHSHGEIYQCSN